MAREYPAFIYQEHTETTSKGRFIYHTIYPRFLGKVINVSNRFQIEVLELIDEDVSTKVLEQKKEKAVYFFLQTIQAKEKQYFGVSIYEAFITLLNVRGSYKTLGLERSSVSTWKKSINEDNKFPSAATMQKYLEMGGWCKVCDEKWEFIF